jgi:hypothetical protein
MNTSVELRVEEIQLEREALFTLLVDAFMRRDFGIIDDVVREGVVAELPGYSQLAGIHKGREAFGRFVVDMRRVLWTTQRSTYSHKGDLMTVKHGVLVMGPRHRVEMTLQIKMRFDADGKIASCLVEPEDLGLFDHVANSTLPYIRI